MTFITNTPLWHIHNKSGTHLAIPYSEKILANFKVLQLFEKDFSGGVLPFGGISEQSVKVSTKIFSYQFTKVFWCESFPLYGKWKTLKCGTTVQKQKYENGSI